MSTVLIGGVFDPLHAGHLAYIRAAKGYGEDLIAVVSDSAKHPPLVPLSDRVQLLRAILGTNRVYTCTPAEAIDQYRPTVYAKGEEWKDSLPDTEKAACKRTGTSVAYIFGTRTNSSSLLLQDYQQRLSAQAVREFEQVVQSQKPADKPWEPVTDYSLEGRRKAEGKHPELIKEVFRPRSVIDVGCGPGHLITLLQELGVHACGIDLRASTDSRLIHAGDIAAKDFGWCSDCDLVVCREVLEHLTVPQIHRAVRNLVKLASPVKTGRAYIYITTRFNESPRHALDVQQSDSLDPTHITMLPKDTLRSWFVAEGCRSRYDLEQRMDWQHKGRCLVFEV